MNLASIQNAWTKTAHLAEMLISSKMGEGRVKKSEAENGSKECACLTCTPCKGLRPVDPTPLAEPLVRR